MSGPGRRGTLLALYGLAGVAALGAGLAWRHRSAPSPPGPIADDPATARLWSARLERPEGGVLEVASLRGRTLLVNFWATWCPPCVKEMPELDRFAREFAGRGVRVLGLAIDSPTPVREFLKRTPVTYPIGLAGLEGTEIARALGNTRGGLPFTVLIGADGRIRHTKAGETTFAELAAWLA